MTSPERTAERRPVRRLDPRVVAQIAAGEMIQRPFSVAKELIENALDAGARQIEVVLGETPDAFLSVADDGVGMGRDDLLLALEPHATSKLRNETDLLAVETLGFRGEAIPSIGRVARLQIVTAEREGEGLRVRIDGGERRPPEIAARSRGTTVQVEELFFNSPVRRRFLKGPDGEVRLIVKLIATTGLAFPEVAFRLTSRGQTLLELPAARDTAERLVALHGADFLARLLAVERETPRGTVQGFVGIPEVARPGTQHQTLLVNRRWVTAPWFSAALRQAFGDLLAPNRNPFALILLSLDPARVDVNVHPTKREVRFLDEGALFGDLVGAVREPLRALVPGWNLRPDDPGSGRIAAIELERGGEIVGEAGGRGSSAGRVGAGGTTAGGAYPDGAEADGAVAWPDLFGPGGDARDGARPPFLEPRVAEGDAPPGGVPPAALTGGGGLGTGGPESVGPETAGPRSAGPADPARGLVPIWQLHQRYLFAQTRQGVLIIDQHAAHERILYERALEHLRGLPAATQQLLFPLPVHLDPDEVTMWRSFAADLVILGVDAEEFGGRTVLLRGVPPSWERDPAGLFREVLQDLSEGRRRGQERVERVAASFACRSAVRSGQLLSLEEMNALVDQLFATSRPHGDPHGRPTFLQIALADLDRRFGRSG